MDPLIEQMNYISLSDRLAGTRWDSSRVRRHSYTSGAPGSGSSPSAEPVVVRSKDGSRWLPAPEERTYRYGGPAHESAIDDEQQDDLTDETEITPHACKATDCAVTEVFATTELLEMIMTHLPTKDIMEQSRTCSKWQDVITMSPKLRLHFFYYPRFCQPSSIFELLPLSLPGLTIELGDELHLGRWIIVRMTLKAARAIAPGQSGKRVRSRSIFEGLRGGLGSRASGSSDSTWPRPQPTTTVGTSLQHRDLFITQPPVVGMQAFTPQSSQVRDNELPESWEDDEQYVPLYAPVAKVSCDAGIHLGFLADTTQSLLASTAGAADDTLVVYKAIVSFCRPESAIRKRSTARQVTRIA